MILLLCVYHGMTIFDVCFHTFFGFPYRTSQNPKIDWIIVPPPMRFSLPPLESAKFLAITVAPASPKPTCISPPILFIVVSNIVVSIPSKNPSFSPNILYSTPRGLAEIFLTKSTSRSMGPMMSRLTSDEKKYVPI